MQKINTKQILHSTIITLCVIACTLFVACSSNQIQEGKFPNTIAENAQVPEKYQAVANELAEFTITEFKDNISKIPRKSGSVEQIRNYIYN